MRRRLSRLATALTLAAGLAVPAAPAPAPAQGDVATEGALFLLLPVGARAVGMGQAVVAERGGSEAVWWNPAGLAPIERFEAAIHHSQTILTTRDAVSLIVPFPLLGVFALSADIVTFQEQEVTDVSGPIGTLLPRSFVFAGTYGTGVGSRFSAGITYKIVQLRIDCTGACPDVAAVSASTSALDLGIQYEPRAGMPLTVGAAVRHVGLRLQVKDSDQADPLPTRLQIGAIYRLPRIAELEGAEFRVAGDVIDRLEVSTPAVRIGGEMVYQERFFLRAGYVIEEGGGPALGLGVVVGGLILDLARVMGGVATDVGEAPIHLSLRYQF
jgi:hypothetical protein